MPAGMSRQINNRKEDMSMEAGSTQGGAAAVGADDGAVASAASQADHSDQTAEHFASALL